MRSEASAVLERADSGMTGNYPHREAASDLADRPLRHQVILDSAREPRATPFPIIQNLTIVYPRPHIQGHGKMLRSE
jgi:hypothetical protein